jgi:uncharacterized protein YndB with AHSA1/START domain
MNPKVSLDFQFTSPIEKVWLALTDANTLAKWLMAMILIRSSGINFSFGLSRLSGGMELLIAKFSRWTSLISYLKLG